MTARTRGTATAAAMGLAALALVSAVLLVPWNMDEFLPFHPLACRQPGQDANTFWEACGDYPTSLFGAHFQRAYHYTGASSSLLLTPLFQVWHSLAAVTLLGLIALGLTGLGFARSLGLEVRSSLLVAAFLPLAFPLLHDTGPVRIGLVVLAWSPVVLRRILVGGGILRQLAWASVLSLAWLVATEDKPFFVFLIPGAAAWCIGALLARHEGALVRRRWRVATAALGCAAVSCLGLLGVMQANGVPYVSYLRVSSDEVGGGPSARGLGAWGSLIAVWPDYTARVRDLSTAGPLGVRDQVTESAWWAGGATAALRTDLAVLLLVSGIVVLAGYAFVLARLLRSATPRSGAGALALSSLLLGLGAWFAGGWAGHHYTFAQLPLLACCALAFRHQQGRLAIGLGLLGLAALAVAQRAPLYPWAGSEVQPAIDRALAAAPPGAVVNCASWGCFYPAQLLARGGVPILYAAAAPQQRTLGADLRTRGGAVVHVCVGCDVASLQQAYGPSSVEPVPTTSNSWSVFVVTPVPG